MIKIAIISDTHNKHKRLTIPNCDVLIHCGDMTSMGYDHEIRSFMKWFTKQNATYKICIAGNHDKLFENERTFALSLIPDNIIYLEDSGVEVLGLKFYGTPVQLPFHKWAFNREEHKLKQHWSAIPDYTDVLITHSPPYGLMDFSLRGQRHIGSPSLYYEVLDRIKPTINCFGHLHEGYGIKIIQNTIFVNASICDDHNEFSNQPIIIDL